MKQIFFSRDTRYKTPYGAVAAGEAVQFCLYPLRMRGVTEMTLFIAEDGNDKEQRRIDLDWSGLDGALEQYTCAYIVPRPGLYWYYFRVKERSGVYYVGHGRGGRSLVARELQNRFQLTAIDGTYEIPSWFGEGISYNIFPDRFRRSRVPAETGYPAQRVVHEQWGDMPVYRPNEHGEILNNDFFGGDLRGIIEKLPYLESLRVRTLYLNPIFEAYSNHRYDTGNYRKIDPMLGTDEDFKELCTQARAYGIRVMLDGVFNHTGFDSLYFNGHGHYDSVGAYQSTQSPYYGWYDFSQWPDKYASWWGIYTLPQVNETNEEYLDYILDNEDSVIRHWLRLGASAWRLDVADELPDSFIARLNRAARREKSDAFVLGEVWEDASNKIAYGERRRYFGGGELDSVMNYPLRESILAFVGGGNAENFEETIEALRENYPHDVFYSLMNVVGTHDTPRILTVLGGRPELWNDNRDARAYALLSHDERALAVRRLRLAAALQFTMPGSPCIYYGDEAGMQGYEDPFNRRTYPWEDVDNEILAYYHILCAIRDDSDALCRGDLRFLHMWGSLLVFERTTALERIVVAVNSAAEPCQAQIDCLAACDLLTGKLYADEDGTRFVRIPLDAQSACILRCAGK